MGRGEAEDLLFEPRLKLPKRIAAQLRPRVHHLTTNRRAGARRTPDRPPDGCPGRTPPPAAVSCLLLLGSANAQTPSYAEPP